MLVGFVTEARAYGLPDVGSYTPLPYETTGGLPIVGLVRP